jgi:plasmid maintenance system killer protein
MKSKATRRFWKTYAGLPVHAQTLANKTYELWRQNSQHPSLHFRKLKGGENRFSVRVGDHYRAIGYLAGDTVAWVWIGTHEDYNKLTN